MSEPVSETKTTQSAIIQSERNKQIAYRAVLACADVLHGVEEEAMHEIHSSLDLGEPTDYIAMAIAKELVQSTTLQKNTSQLVAREGIRVMVGRGQALASMLLGAIEYAKEWVDELEAEAAGQPLSRHFEPWTVAPAEVRERIEILSRWPRSYGDAISNDPRCGCGEDGEGGKCEWDDIEELEHWAGGIPA